MKERLLTCIVCPKGCQLKVELSEENKVESVEGNACKRGLVYAEDECTNPKRTVTSTIKMVDGTPVAVKTSEAVPKELVSEIMSEINLVRCSGYLEVGDVVIKGVCGLSADVVATANSK